MKRTDFDVLTGSRCRGNGSRPVTNQRNARRRVAESLALRIAALGVSCVLVAATGGAVADQVPPVDSSTSSTPFQRNAALPGLGEAEADFSADVEARKSYGIPAAEILVFDSVLNLINRHFVSSEYESNFHRA